MEAALVAIAAVTAGFLVWRLRRRHTGVPRGWQTDQSHAADLHRRLHRCIDHTRRDIARAGTRGAPIDKLVTLTDDLDAQARGIDTQLVAASRLPSAPRERSLRDLRYRVIEVEKLAARVDEIVVELTGPVLGAADAGIRDLQLRIDALEQARKEAYEIGPEGPGPVSLPEPPEASRPQGEERPGTG
ncbi:MAG TPA: hypothetical protein VMQ81_06095 [Acidimicrobiia bacterium]|nr:hypothetical protein [Acidimicrobiia bacterium]